MNNSEKDFKQLYDLVNEVTKGNFTYAKAEHFDNAEVASAFNAMLDAIMYRNNYFLARINDAQSRIADNSSAKAMMECIEGQREPILELRKARGAFSTSLDKTSEGSIEALALSKQMQNTFEACERYGKRSIQALQEALEISGEKEIKDVIAGSLTSLKNENELVASMLPNIKALKDDIKTVYETVDMHTKDTERFLGHVDSITENYDKLFSACISAGRKLYRISRDIDNAREDTYQKNSWPLLHDRLKIFVVDHLTLVWRLYNNIVEFENLNIGDISESESCKFGEWLVKQKDENLIACEAFRSAVYAHEELHTHAINCCLAKEAYRREEALEEFEEALQSYEKMKEAIDGLHDYFRSIGITKETEVWTYEE